MEKSKEDNKKCEAFEISEKVRDTFNLETAKLILHRADILADSKLEQLRKATDRMYTLFGILATVFSGLIVLLFKYHQSKLMIPCFVLCLGMGIAIFYMIFKKTFWVHSFQNIGSSPKNLIIEENIESLMEEYKKNKDLANKEYQRNITLDCLKDDENAICINAKALNRKVRYFNNVMKIIKVTIFIATLTATIIALGLIL